PSGRRLVTPRLHLTTNERIGIAGLGVCGKERHTSYASDLGFPVGRLPPGHGRRRFRKKSQALQTQQNDRRYEQRTERSGQHGRSGAMNDGKSEYNPSRCPASSPFAKEISSPCGIK